MADDDQFSLFWHGAEIGAFANPVPDMWYLEGLWKSNQTEAAATFEALARKLNPQEVYNNLPSGIEVLLQDADGSRGPAIVISLSSANSLFIRRMLRN